MATFGNTRFPGGTTHIHRVSASANSQVLTVPAGSVWEVEWGHVVFASGTVAGNRHLFAEILDDANNVIWISKALNFQTASLSGDYLLIPGNHEALQNVSLNFTVAFPRAILPPGSSVRVRDGNNVSAADTLVFTLAYIRTAS